MRLPIIEDYIDNKDQPKRKDKPNIIVVHHSGNDVPFKNELNYQRGHEYVNYQYLVSPDGTIYKMCDDEYITYHAGISNWGKQGQQYDSYGKVKLTGLNPFSIGVCIQSGGEKFTSKQKASAFNLLVSLSLKHDISPEYIIRHADITQTNGRSYSKELAPSRSDSVIKRSCRKWDVGVNFWKRSNWSWKGYQNRIGKEVAKYRR